MCAARAAGSYLYSEGYRLCVSGFSGSLKKTSLQSAFGDFGHIVQIETPKPGIAFVAFRDQADAEDARKTLDGQLIDGRTVSVSKAEPKPSPRLQSAETPRTLLMTTQFEMEEVRAQRAQQRMDFSGVDRGGRAGCGGRASGSRGSRSRDRMNARKQSRSRRSRSRQDTWERRGRVPSKSHSRKGCSRSRGRRRRSSSASDSTASRGRGSKRKKTSRRRSQS
mmetsp:Transcript_103251/g.205230  ORF Transcript_103251/g.205230 Transcript_103251/m.205230 type:complete len:222 (+) Transcript_103251:79-744(+)